MHRQLWGNKQVKVDCKAIEKMKTKIEITSMCVYV